MYINLSYIHLHIHMCACLYTYAYCSFHDDNDGDDVPGKGAQAMPLAFSELWGCSPPQKDLGIWG